VIEVAVGLVPSARHLGAMFLRRRFLYEAVIDRPHTRKRVCLAPQIESLNKDVGPNLYCRAGLRTSNQQIMGRLRASMKLDQTRCSSIGEIRSRQSFILRRQNVIASKSHYLCDSGTLSIGPICRAPSGIKHSVRYVK
jgi:hypothetical protein